MGIGRDEGSAGRRWSAPVAGTASVVLAALLILAAVAGGAGPVVARGERAGLFDYYALSLSWSPSYCLRTARRGRARRRGGDDAQCRRGRRLGFVVHGLWPQFRRGWPSDCRGAKRFVPDAVIREVLDVMPSKGLVIHEWRRHGTCSGLSPRGYFTLLEKLFRQVRIPPAYERPGRALKRAPEQIRREFAEVNRERGFTRDSFAVVCGGAGGGPVMLKEVRVCFTPTGRPSRCGENERRGACRARIVIVPPVR